MRCLSEEERFRQIARSEILRRDRLRRAYERDLATRISIGLRVPNELGERVRQAASSQGLSVYRWLYDLIERALTETDVS